MEIKATQNYKMFKNIVGNRGISKGHLTRLSIEVAKKNLLEYNPIIVNEKMEVIDGQHRLEVAKANGFPIYYIIQTGGGLVDVQAINSSIKPWSGYDYLQSYATTGNKHYQTLKGWVDDYKINIAQVLELASNGSSGGTWSLFKKGRFVIENPDEAEMRVTAYAKLRAVVPLRVFADRDFVRSIITLMQVMSIEEFIAHIQHYGKQVEYRQNRREYLRQFEEIINFRKSVNYRRMF